MCFDLNIPLDILDVRGVKRRLELQEKSCWTCKNRIIIGTWYRCFRKNEGLIPMTEIYPIIIYPIIIETALKQMGTDCDKWEPKDNADKT